MDEVSRDNPSAGVMHEIHEVMRRFSVALFVYPTKAEITRRNLTTPVGHTTNGSGVLLEIGGRLFILTAGHVVEEVDGNEVIIPTSRQPVTEPVEVVWSAHGGDTGVGADFGVIEVWQKANIEGRSHAFMSPGRVGRLGEHNKVFTCGTPGAQVQPTGPHAMESQVFAVHAPVLGKAGVPSPPSPSPKTAVRNFEVCLMASRARAFGAKPFDPKEVIRDRFALGGMSGGGVWTAEIADDGQSWVVGSHRLVATHCSSVMHEGDLFEDDAVKYTRAVLIDEHLELIFGRYPALRAEYERVRG